MAKRDVETATIAVAAFNDDVKEDLLFCSPFVFKSACVSDDDRGDMMMMSDDNKRAYINPHNFCRVCLFKRKKIRAVYFRVSQYTLNEKFTRTKEEFDLAALL